MPGVSIELRRQVEVQARELGFDAIGFARADEPLEADHEHYLEFLARGMHGDMGYLAKNAEVRRSLDGEGIVAGAKTVICLSRRYDRDETDDPPLARTVARYARGRDYHNHLRKRIGRLARFVAGLEVGAKARALCDTAPVLERAWAARSGLGFVGKNGLLIVPGQGSYCLLGEVVTTVALVDHAPDPLNERCGSCTLCLEACPTDAFVAPRVLDPRRCISYATIEARSPAPNALADAIGEHLFGCDDCQQVCPYNAIAPPSAEKTKPFQPHERWSRLTLLDFVTLDEAQFARALEGSPLRRATRVGMARNAVLHAASQRGDAEAGARAVLAAGAQHDDAGVRRLARAALARCEELNP